MEPITIINAAAAIAKLTGLSSWIGKKLGGDKGEQVADSVVGIAQQFTGATTPEQAIEIITQNQQMANDLKLRILENGEELERMAYADTENARAMQIAALGQEDKFSKRFVYYFAAAVTLFAFTYISCITFGTIPSENVRFADTSLGFLLGSVLATIFGFFYGSTRGSNEKTNVVAALASKIAGNSK